MSARPQTRQTMDEPRLEDSPSVGEWASTSCLNRYARGAELFRQGTLLRDVLYIERGIVKLVYLERSGRESILGLAYPHQWVGIASVIAGRPAPASALACADVVVRRISAESCRRRLRSDAGWSLEIHEAHALEVCRQMACLGHWSASNSRERLRRMIREFIAAMPIQHAGDGVRVIIPVRRWELARLLGIAPEHLSRLLREIEIAGLIRREKNGIVVPDVDRLCPAAEWGEGGVFIGHGTSTQAHA